VLLSVGSLFLFLLLLLEPACLLLIVALPGFGLALAGVVLILALLPAVCMIVRPSLPSSHL